MPVDCQRSTSGGKGNRGLFVERDPRVCAAGLPTAQPDETVADSLQYYLLKDEADALLSDTIVPDKKPRPLPPLRHPIPLDKRHGGLFCDVAQMINPPIQSKFQTLVEDVKNTNFASYWKRPLGEVKDPVPMLPEGFDAEGTTFGKKTQFEGRLYDIVMPKVPYPDKTPPSKKHGAQKNRNFCSPPFDPDLCYGHRTNVNKSGIYAKCCLTDDRKVLGNGMRTVVNSIQSNFQDYHQPRVGTVLSPNDNITCVPKGYSFGILKPPDNLPECLTFCEIDSAKYFYRKCLKHYNTLRKCMSTRFLPTFYRNFYLNLKYFDKEKTGWLPKEVVYNFCGTKLIRFDPAFIEPLLALWKAFDGSRIEYKIFARVLNHKQPPLDLPKIPDFPRECLNFLTTYQEMVMPGQEADKSLMAGTPSGRYLDLDYPVTPHGGIKAHRTCLPHESDMRSCISPNILTSLNVSHRDMYKTRDPAVVRRVFEATGEQFTDERFNSVWEEAKKYHSQGCVCYETFRRALENMPK